MPEYRYEVLTEDGKPTGKILEVVQRMKDDAWERVPTTLESGTIPFGEYDGKPLAMNYVTNQYPHAGKRCRRVIFAPRVQVRAGTTEDAAMPDHLKMPMTQRESRVHWYPERDIGRARKEIGGQAAECIQPDGRVVYRSLADERRFKRAFANAENRKAQRGVDVVVKTGGDDAFSGQTIARKVPKKLKKRRAEFA
jgi:hypothetical protein